MAIPSIAIHCILQISTQTNCLLLRKDALLKCGLFDESLLRHQDVQLLTRFTFNYKLFSQDEFLNNLDIDDNKNSDEGKNEVDYRKIIKPKKSFSLKMDCRSRAASAVQDEKKPKRSFQNQL